MPDPANPQSFNRYSYVENHPLNFNDPTGHFTEDAIRGYLWEYCAGDESCFTKTFNQWRGNNLYWQMLLDAEAGDIMVVGVSSADSVYGLFFKFSGSGRTRLAGIFQSDELGNRIGDDIGLDKIISNASMDWVANIRWVESQGNIPYPDFKARADIKRSISRMQPGEAQFYGFIFSQMMKQFTLSLGDLFKGVLGNVGKLAPDNDDIVGNAFSDLVVQVNLTKNGMDLYHFAFQAASPVDSNNIWGVRWALVEGYYRRDTNNLNGSLPHYFRWQQGGFIR